jgi:hypothetical protein
VVFSQSLQAADRRATMAAKVINFQKKLREKEKERIIASINEYYRLLRERGWIVCKPQKEK